MEIPPRPRETEKRPLEKLTKTVHESLDIPSEKKRSRVESPVVFKSRSLSSSPDSQSKPLLESSGEDDKVRLAAKVEKAEEDSEATDIEENADTDAGDFAAFADSLSCVVCSKLHVLPGNQLVECQDCHNMYHQECHKPPASDAEISDPRFVWYCAKCTKNQKKISVKTTKQQSMKPPAMSASSAFQAAINQGKESAMQLVKAAKDKDKESAPAVQPFRRSELKSTSSSGGTSAPAQAKPIGLAGLAANLNRVVTTTAAGSSSANVPTSTPSSTVSAVADKRLQMMKKKAAKANDIKKKGAGTK